MLENIILLLFSVGMCINAKILYDMQNKLEYLENEVYYCKYRAKCSNETKY